MTCAEFNDRVDAWLAGALSDGDVRVFEEHAAACAVCGQRLDALSRMGDVSRELAPPPALRAATLRAVASRRTAARWRRNALGVIGIAAIALLAIMTGPARKSASDFPGAGKELLAMEHARPEFAELDAAEREVERALRDRPGDDELAASLMRIRRQRDALRLLVQQAKS